MPTSPNRRRIEIPAALFVRLEERARRDGQTLAGLVTTLLASALDAPTQPAPRAADAGTGNPDLPDLIQQLLHNDALQLRELQFVQQRLDGVLRALVEGQPAFDNPDNHPTANPASRQRLLEALTEAYVALPPRPPATLAHTGEPRPVLSRTLWQRPQEPTAPDPADKSEE
jgi:hypothetical protein